MIEILLTVVLTGITVGALLLSLASAGNAGIAQRSLVTADVVMRNYAEAAKAAAAQACGPPGLAVDFTPPDGYTATVVNPATTPACPSPLASSVLTLQVTGPGGIHQTMQIEVRSP